MQGRFVLDPILRCRRHSPSFDSRHPDRFKKERLEVFPNRSFHQSSCNLPSSGSGGSGWGEELKTGAKLG